MNCGTPAVNESSDRFETRVRLPTDLSAAEREWMFQLMSDHYEHIRRTDFERDLDEKEWVITTVDATESILGFTTLMRLTATLETGRVTALFCGDTVFDPAAWGSGSWVRVWGRHVAAITKKSSEPLFFLLMTATHRTYRFLPSFFKEYYPRPEASTPRIVLERTAALSRLKFSEEYDAKSGIVRLKNMTPVKPDRVGMATEGLEGTDAEFFVARNPGYLNGDYLVCLAELSADNYTRLGRKLFCEPDLD